LAGIDEVYGGVDPPDSGRVNPQPDGTLSVKAPDTLLAAFQSRLALAPQAVLGPWQTEGAHITGGAVGRAASLLLADLPDTCRVEMDLGFAPGAASFGLLLRADTALDHYYMLRFEPANQRMAFDRWPRPGDQPFMLERPLPLAAGKPIHLRLLLDGTCVVAYVDDRVALCCRLYPKAEHSLRVYEHRSGMLGLFSSEGETHFMNIEVLK
jgi:beta-fructofuranosidase